MAALPQLTFLYEGRTYSICVTNATSIQELDDTLRMKFGIMESVHLSYFETPTGDIIPTSTVIAGADMLRPYTLIPVFKKVGPSSDELKRAFGNTKADFANYPKAVQGTTVVKNIKEKYGPKPIVQQGI